jgi:hypothetical protein
VSALLTIVIGGSVLFLYVMFEKRIQQRYCLECRAKISLDDAGGKCPGCSSFLEYEKNI